MQKPITPFNCNIEILRDIAETIGVHYLNNGNSNISFATTEYGRIQIMIHNHRYRNADNINSVCVEYQGDGVMSIHPCDSYGYPIGDKYELFDTHWHPGGDHVKIFHDMIKNKFNITI